MLRLEAGGVEVPCEGRGTASAGSGVKRWTPRHKCGCLGGLCYIPSRALTDPYTGRKHSNVAGLTACDTPLHPRNAGLVKNPRSAGQALVFVCDHLHSNETF